MPSHLKEKKVESQHLTKKALDKEQKILTMIVLTISKTGINKEIVSKSKVSLYVCQNEPNKKYLHFVVQYKAIHFTIYL